MKSEPLAAHKLFLDVSLLLGFITQEISASGRDTYLSRLTKMLITILFSQTIPPSLSEE